MDGVSGAASVVALLQTVTNIWKFISQVKHAPENVRQSLENIKHLLSTVENLRGLPNGSTEQAELEQYLQECAADLKSFHDKLQKLRGNANGTGITWRSLRIQLKKEYVRQISNDIDNHYQRLSMKLQTIKHANIESLHTKMDLHFTAQNEAARVQQDMLRTLEILRAALTSQPADSSSANRLSDKIQDVQSLVQELVSQNQTRQSQKTGNQTASAHDAASQTSPNTHTSDPEINGKFQDAIESLRGFANEEGRTHETQEAETLLTKMYILFESLRKSESKENLGVPITSVKRKADESDQDELYDRELKKFRGTSDSHEVVKINGNRYHSDAVSRTKFVSQFKHVIRQPPSGRVTLQLWLTKDKEQSSDDRGNKSNKAIFQYIPYDKGNPYIAINLIRQPMRGSTLYLDPVLNVSTIREYGSLGYELILRGNLEGFRKSLSRREIYLHDRDPVGRSYLNYALFASQPEICHFLLENGAERDFAEPAITWDGSDRDHTKLINEDYHSKGDISERYSFNVHFDRDNEEVNYVGSFSAVSSNIIETDIEHQPCLNYCHLLLLEANADPSITVSSYDASHIRGTLSVGTAQSLRQLLNLGLHYSERTDELDSREWLQYHLQSHRWTYESVDLLLSRQGTNGLPFQKLELCLHIAMWGSDYASLLEMEQVLVRLIKAGANILQRHDYYRSVFEMACSESTCYYTSSNGGSRVYNSDFVLKDVLSRALSNCGFDADKEIERGLKSPGLPLTYDRFKEALERTSLATGYILHEEWDFIKASCNHRISTTDEDSENTSENDGCETIYEDSEDECENIQDDDSSSINEVEEFASSGEPMEEDPEISNPPFLNSEARLFLEQDAQVWMD